MELADHGLVRSCARGETGMLAVEARGIAGERADLVRNVVKVGDRWLLTGDLFRRDEDGDLWLVDPASALVDRGGDLVTPSIARAALERLPWVSLAVGYGVSDGRERLVVALTKLPGARVNRKQIDSALGLLPARDRPDIVHLLDEIPVTSWYRPDVAALRAAGVAGEVLWEAEAAPHTTEPRPEVVR